MFILGCAFVMLFAFAFSNFANFGYLARQRAQIMPILGAMTLLLLPRGASAGRNHGSALAASVADSAPKGLAVADGNVR